MYLHRRGWTDARQFSIQTVAGRDPPDDPRRAHVPRRHGPRAARDRGRGRGLRASSRSSSATRSARSASRAPRPSSRRSTCRRSARRSSTTSCSPPTARTSRGGPSSSPSVIRARIFERGVGETMSSGTGATGAAIAHVLRGGDSPVTVRLDGGELEVDVGEDLHVDLTGWAVPVFARRARSRRRAGLPDRVAVGRAAVAVALVEPLRLLQRRPVRSGRRCRTTRAGAGGPPRLPHTPARHSACSSRLIVTPRVPLGAPRSVWTWWPTSWATM